MNKEVREHVKPTCLAHPASWCQLCTFGKAVFEGSVVQCLQCGSRSSWVFALCPSVGYLIGLTADLGAAYTFMTASVLSSALLMGWEKGATTTRLTIPKLSSPAKCQWLLSPWALPNEESPLTAQSAVAPRPKQPIPRQHASKHITRNAKHACCFDLIIPAILKGVYQDVTLQPVPRLTGMLIENTLQVHLQRTASLVEL